MNQEFAGAASYASDYVEEGHRLLVAVFCLLPENQSTYALLDTAAQWCILPASVARQLGLDLEPDGSTPPLHTRFGTFFGRLERLPVVFEAEDGAPLAVEATWFVSPEWTGPAVIGWKGCLERMRFAIDPFTERWYFASE